MHPYAHRPITRAEREEVRQQILNAIPLNHAAREQQAALREGRKLPTPDVFRGARGVTWEDE